MRFKLPPGSSGQRTAFLLVLVTSFQASFLLPNVTLLLDERTNLFTGLLCGLSLVGAWLFTDGIEQRLRSRGFWLSLALVLLGGASILASHDASTAFYRGSVALTSSLGGYWCGRTVLGDPAWRRLFAKACLVMLFFLALFCIGGVLADGNINDLLSGTGKHPLANRIMLLWFAPLAFIATDTGLLRWSSMAVMVVSYAAIYVSGLRTTVLMPIVLGMASILLGILPLRWTLAALVAFSLLATGFFLAMPEEWQVITTSDREEVYYRLESFPFSLHIVEKHPLLGVGLRTDRMDFYEDYEVKYPYVSRRQFKESLQKIVTSENSLLTIATGFGLPFALLYLTGLLWTYGCLVISMVRLPSSQSLAMLSLFLPITAGITYAQIYDAVMYPQICWFFHLLVGMAPRRPLQPQKRMALSS